MNEYKGLPYCVEVNSRPIPYRPDKKEDAHVHYDFAFVLGMQATRSLMSIFMKTPVTNGFR